MEKWKSGKVEPADFVATRCDSRVSSLPLAPAVLLVSYATPAQNPVFDAALVKEARELASIFAKSLSTTRKTSEGVKKLPKS